MNDEQLIEKYTQVMGMKTGEVLEVKPVDGGHAVLTHDKRWTLVRDDGTFVLGDEGQAAPVFTHERDAGVAEPDAKDESAAKNAPKGRGR